MASIKTDSYIVEGMTCSGCERAIQDEISALEGVLSVKADMSQATVSVAYDAGKVSIDDIKSSIGNIGYRFAGVRPPAGQREGRDDAVS